MRSIARWVAFFTALCFAAVVVAEGAEEDRVIVPGRAADASTPASSKAESTGGSGGMTIALVVMLAGAGGWMLWRQRIQPAGTRTVRHLQIEETRSLGGRQFLVVASYREKKFLLGVCQGRIDLLSPLDGEVPAESKELS